MQSMFLSTLFFFIMMNFFTKWNSIISLLLTFEMLILSFIFVFSMKFFSTFFLLFFLFVGVMEAIFGLSILLFTMRFTGKENFLF